LIPEAPGSKMSQIYNVAQEVVRSVTAIQKQYLRKTLLTTPNNYKYKLFDERKWETLLTQGQEYSMCFHFFVNWEDCLNGSMTSSSE